MHSYSSSIFFKPVGGEYVLDMEKLEDSAVTLKAIAHPLRLAIVDLLTEHDQLTVKEIYRMLDIEQAVASHHLGILKDKRVLKARRSGKNIKYELANRQISRLLESLA